MTGPRAATVEPINAITSTRVASREFRVTASGIWTPEYADAHFAELKAMLTAARKEVGGLRVLVDLRGANVQPAATADRVRFWTANIYEASDRVAMLVSSSLLKLQMRRVAVIATRELFSSEAAAVDWLRSS